MTDEALRPVVWMGGSRTDLAAMPKPVRDSLGFRLQDVQRGKTPRDSKPLPQLGQGVWELRDNYDKNAYRLMYVLKLKRAIYVLHVFMKKSKSGISLPRPDAATIAIRLKLARRLDQEN